jgi:hypothetical protein
MMAAVVVDEEDTMKRIGGEGFRVGTVYDLVGFWEGGFWGKLKIASRGNREGDRLSMS